MLAFPFVLLRFAGRLIVSIPSNSTMVFGKPQWFTLPGVNGATRSRLGDETGNRLGQYQFGELGNRAKPRPGGVSEDRAQGPERLANLAVEARASRPRPGIPVFREPSSSPRLPFHRPPRVSPARNPGGRRAAPQALR